MHRHGFVRLVLLILLIATFYFVLTRNRNHHNRSNDRSPIATIEPFLRKEPELSGHPKTGRRRSDRENRGFDSSARVSCSSHYFSNWEEPEVAACAVRLKNSYPVPDSKCTPGGINPSISTQVLHDPRWRTRSIRNCESSESEKHIEYRWYGIQKPRINSDRNLVCELDHLVPLELGGADGLGNIWPQCGPDGVTLEDRFFKHKDHVENYLAEQVREGRMSLDEAQRGIASDWTQYLRYAELWCAAKGRC
jgi:hypothetical protein